MTLECTVNPTKQNFKHLSEKQFPMIRILHFTIILWHHMFNLKHLKATVYLLATGDTVSSNKRISHIRE
jgi:hypothetical protein